MRPQHPHRGLLHSAFVLGTAGVLLIAGGIRASADASNTAPLTAGSSSTPADPALAPWYTGGGATANVTAAAYPLPTGYAAGTPTPTPTGPEKFIRPVASLSIVSPMGMRMHPFLHVLMTHTGDDLQAACGEPVRAAASGTVTYADISDSWGGRVIIEHDNLEGGARLRTAYAHLSVIYAQEGDRVTQGQLIGLVGTTGWSTGCHLHFDVIDSKGYVNPAPYLVDMVAPTHTDGAAHPGRTVPNVKRIPTTLPTVEDGASGAPTVTSGSSSSTSKSTSTATRTATSTAPRTTTATKSATTTRTSTTTSSSTATSTTTKTTTTTGQTSTSSPTSTPPASTTVSSTTGTSTSAGQTTP